MNKGAISIVLMAVIVLAVVAVVAQMTISASAVRGKVECNDKKDNDYDGKIDLADAGCANRNDNDESNCGDGACEGVETCASCVADCGPCPTTSVPTTSVETTIPTTSIPTTIPTTTTVNATTSVPTTVPTTSVPTTVLTTSVPTTVVTTTSLPANSCADTDGGNVLTVKGTVSGYLGGFPYSNDDFCLGNYTILENYCVGNFAYNQTANCLDISKVCINGACM